MYLGDGHSFQPERESQRQMEFTNEISEHYIILLASIEVYYDGSV